jgi:hypothetical protein
MWQRFHCWTSLVSQQQKTGLGKSTEWCMTIQWEEDVDVETLVSFLGIGMLSLFSCLVLSSNDFMFLSKSEFDIYLQAATKGMLFCFSR